MSIPVSFFAQFSIAAAQAGLPNYNMSNLALLTKEAPVSGFGTGATAAASLTGTSVSAIAVSAAGTGYTTPPPVIIVSANGAGSGAVAIAAISGGLVTGIAVVNGGTGYTETPVVIIGNGIGIYADADSVGVAFGTGSETFEAAENVFSQALNISTGDGQLIVYAMNSTDTILTAIQAVLGQIFCGAFLAVGYTPNNSETTAAATFVQSLSPPRLLGAPTSLLSDLYSGGLAAIIQAAGQQQTRALIYTIQAEAVSPAQAARLYAAAYFSRLLSVNRSGTNTFATQNLKQFANVQPDTGINSTILNQCELVGADPYPIIGSVLPGCVSTGGNNYADTVFGQGCLLGDVQVATFNYLAQTATKIPQTENGMNGLKGACIAVLDQYVTNGFVAPGTWTGSIPFGDPATFLQNISQYGYYIYSIPIGLQNPADRLARKAPLIQMAVKLAGAIQQTQGTIFVQP